MYVAALGNVEVTTTTSVEQEKYFAALVSATPYGNAAAHHTSLTNGGGGAAASDPSSVSEATSFASDSLSSLESLGLGDALALVETPMLNRRHPLMRSLAGFRATYPGRPKCKACAEAAAA